MIRVPGKIGSFMDMTQLVGWPVGAHCRFPGVAMETARADTLKPEKVSLKEGKPSGSPTLTQGSVKLKSIALSSQTPTRQYASPQQ